MAVDYNAIYKQAYDNLATPFDEQLKYYENSKNEQIGALDASRTAGEQKLSKAKEQAMQAAYWNRLQAQRDLPKALASQGIRGGLTETAYGDLLGTYENSRNAATDSYNNQIANLRNDYNEKVAGINSAFETNKGNLYQQRRAEAYNMAQILYQQAVEEEERQRQAAAAAAARSYSGGGGSDDSDGGTKTEYQRRRDNNVADTNAGIDPYAWQNRSYGSGGTYRGGSYTIRGNNGKSWRVE